MPVTPAVRQILLSTQNYAARWGVVSQWRFNGDGQDSVGTNHLTNNNSATFGAGKSDRATSLVAASSQYWSVAGNSSLATGNVDFGGSLWVNPSTLTVNHRLMVKGNTNTSDAEFQLVVSSNASAQVNVSANGTTLQAAAASFGISTGLWNHIFWWFDHIAGTMNICVNNGAVNSASGITPPSDQGGIFAIGATTTAAAPLNGSIDNVIYFKSPPSGIAAVVSEMIAKLYNNGNGREQLIF